MLHTLYARNEPTTDSATLALAPSGKKDVVLYKDEACTQPYCRWSWHLSPPRRNWNRVCLNSWFWTLKWLPELAPQLHAAQTS